MNNRGPMFDNPAELDKLIGTHMNTEMPTPEIANLRDMLLELALRVQELRETVLTQATEHNGRMWIQADTVIRLLDGTE